MQREHKWLTVSVERLKIILEGGSTSDKFKKDGIYVCEGGAPTIHPGKRGWGWTFFK